VTEQSHSWHLNSHTAREVSVVVWVLYLVFEVGSGLHIHMAYLSFSLLLHLLVRAVIFHRNVKCGPVLQECFSGFIRVHSHNGG
jgi:hypothetical protein